MSQGRDSRHVVRPADSSRPAAPPEGFIRRPAVDETVPGAVHTGFAVCELAAGASVGSHVHSYEECVYGIDGTVVLQTAEGATRIGPGDYALLPVGQPHAWRNEGDVPVRWAEMVSPQPRARYGGDTCAVPELPRTAPVGVDVRDPRVRGFGHVSTGNLDVARQTQGHLAVSASMRTALLVYSGITVKMMVDPDLGAELTTMFMVHYDPDGQAGPHDHPFEETYLFLEGEAEGTFDGETYLLRPGDVAFAGAGCVHSFRNAGGGPLRWLETQAPQPPARHSYRFRRDWEYLQLQLDQQLGQQLDQPVLEREGDG